MVRFKRPRCPAPAALFSALTRARCDEHWACTLPRFLFLPCAVPPPMHSPPIRPTPLRPPPSLHHFLFFVCCSCFLGFLLFFLKIIIGLVAAIFPRHTPTRMQASSEAEETLKRIQSHRGVTGIVIVTKDGVPIKSTLSAEDTVQHAALFTQLASKARSVIRTLDPQNDLTFLRVRSKKHEIMVAPDKDYLLFVIQNPNSEEN